MKTLALLCSLLLCAVCQAQATAVIEGPTQVSPGDLVILDASQSVCDTQVWLLATGSKSFLPVDGGKRCVFASGQPGEYVFILSTARSELKQDSAGEYTASSTIAVARHTVTVAGPHPTPTPPTPVPPPEPTPPVVPTPVPTPAPLAGVALRAFTAVKSITASADEVRHFAASLRAGAAVEGTVEQMRSAYVGKLMAGPFAQAEVRTRWDSIAKVLVVTEMQETTDPVVARQVFNAIADGLERSLTTSVGAAARESLMQRKNAVEGAVESLEAEIGIR